jgi:ABC-type uncharacterized transport system YnjBCD permease subunit
MGERNEYDSILESASPVGAHSSVPDQSVKQVFLLLGALLALTVAGTLYAKFFHRPLFRWIRKTNEIRIAASLVVMAVGMTLIWGMGAELFYDRVGWYFEPHEWLVTWRWFMLVATASLSFRIVSFREKNPL